METNNAPFYVGQRVVCVNDTDYAREPVLIITSSLIRAGQTYEVLNIRQTPCCEKWEIDVGIITKPGVVLCVCGKTCFEEEITYFLAYRFAPIQPAYESATSEILSKFQPTDEKSDKVLKPEKVKL